MPAFVTELGVLKRHKRQEKVSKGGKWGGRMGKPLKRVGKESLKISGRMERLFFSLVQESPQKIYSLYPECCAHPFIYQENQSLSQEWKLSWLEIKEIKIHEEEKTVLLC